MHISPIKPTINPTSFYPKGADNSHGWQVKFTLEYTVSPYQRKVTFNLPPCSLDDVKQWIDRVLSAKAFWEDRRVGEGRGPTLHFVDRVVEVAIMLQ